ncbi:MAG: DUF92 domain-containing protein, partial [Candidatus Eremiobacteraeota bacterium]|nr:DUF92 domain-containing protein [Candidatus Eremiobacteraeota bacterium]
AAGAAAVAGVAAGAGIAPFTAVVAGGFSGALLDSVLGALVQELRYCPACREPCETDPHRCGAATLPVRGAAWMNNDAVNLAATACGAAVAAAIAFR